LRAGRSRGDLLRDEGALEVAVVVVFVADDDLPGPRRQVGLAEDAQQDLPPVSLRPCQGVADGQLVQSEPARMGGAVPVLGPSGQLGALGGPHRAGRTPPEWSHDPDVLGPQAGAGGQDRAQCRTTPAAAREPGRQYDHDPVEYHGCLA
jgi:hypothetical protein